MSPRKEQQDNTPADTSEPAFLPNDVPKRTMPGRSVKETKDGRCDAHFFLAHSVIVTILNEEVKFYWVEKSHMNVLSSLERYSKDIFYLYVRGYSLVQVFPN